MKVKISEVNNSMELFDAAKVIAENVKMYLPDEDVDMEKAERTVRALNEMNFKLETALMVSKIESRDYISIPFLVYLEYKAYVFLLNRAMNK